MVCDGLRVDLEHGSHRAGPHTVKLAAQDLREDCLADAGGISHRLVPDTLGAESKQVVRALNAAAADVSFVEIQSDAGHDSFLLDVPEFFGTVHAFLNAVAAQNGLPTAALRNDPAASDPSQDRIS